MAKNANRSDQGDALSKQTIAKEKKANENTKANRKRSSRAKTIIFAAELVVLLILLGGLYLLRDFGDTGIVRVEFEPEDIQMNEPVKENEIMKGYRNIALFGVDSVSGALTKNTRSDSIIIASVNQDTGDVKLVSVYRDTYLNLGNGKYAKCNSAYMYGGAKQAMTMLNRNLDLDITDFVTVGFEGLKATIDALGGVWVNVEKAEIVHLNNYQITMAKDLKCDYKKVKEPGYQLLDGLQAVAYCRIRYTKGNDFKRAERQREVINAIAQQAQQADAQTLIDIANKVSESGAVYTSLELTEILELLKSISKYEIVGETGFPAEKYRGTAKMGSDGDCVLPLDLEKNVILLHNFLFEAQDYEVSDTVIDYSKEIREDVAVYQPNMKYPN